MMPYYATCVGTQPTQRLVQSLNTTSMPTQNRPHSPHWTSPPRIDQMYLLTTYFLRLGPAQLDPVSLYQQPQHKLARILPTDLYKPSLQLQCPPRIYHMYLPPTYSSLPCTSPTRPCCAIQMTPAQTIPSPAISTSSGNLVFCAKTPSNWYLHT